MTEQVYLEVYPSFWIGQFPKIVIKYRPQDKQKALALQKLVNYFIEAKPEDIDNFLYGKEKEVLNEERNCRSI